jgi:ActR/RegA family two-component response regulator
MPKTNSGAALRSDGWRVQSPSDGTNHEWRSNGQRLLFVDDEPGIRQTLPVILEQRGFKVHVASTAEEAIAIMQSDKFDVLLSDLNIGAEGDGFAVVSEMRRLHPKCVNLLLTGFPAFESAVEAIRRGVDDYFVKPADIEVILNTIKKKLKESETA